MPYIRSVQHYRMELVVVIFSRRSSLRLRQIDYIETVLSSSSFTVLVFKLVVPDIPDESKSIQLIGLFW